VAYVNADVKSKNCLLSLFCGEKVVMRSIFVAAVAAASVLLAGVVFASGNSSPMKRPLVTVAPAPASMESPVLIAAEAN
jgi:hypothetical protein